MFFVSIGLKVVKYQHTVTHTLLIVLEIKMKTKANSTKVGENDYIIF